MMNRILCLLAVVLGMLIGGSANAGIVNNSGTTGEDSLCLAFSLLDTLGNPVAGVSGDSLWVYSYYPGGALAAVDSCRILTDAKITSRTLRGALLEYSYKNAVAALDGGGMDGTYKYTVVARDSSLSLYSTFRGEFQVVQQNDFGALAKRIDSLRLVATNILADVRAVGADAITDNADGRLEVNVEEWADVAVATPPSVKLAATGSDADTGIVAMKTKLTTIAGYTDDIGTAGAGLTAVKLAPTGSDADTGIVAIKTKLTTIAGDVVNIDGGALTAVKLAATGSDADTGIVAMKTKLTTIAGYTDDIGAAGAGLTAIAATVWTATGGDSVLQALDYTNNTHEVLRQVVSTLATVTNVTAVAGLADTIRDVIGDTLNASSGKVYVAVVDGLADTVRDVIGDTLNASSGNVYVAVVNGLGDTLRDVVGDSINKIVKKATWNYSGTGDSTPYVNRYTDPNNLVFWKGVVIDTVAPTTSAFWAQVSWPTTDSWPTGSTALADAHLAFLSGSLATRGYIRHVSTIVSPAGHPQWMKFTIYSTWGSAPTVGDTVCLLKSGGFAAAIAVALNAIGQQSIQADAINASELGAGAVSEIVDSLIMRFLTSDIAATYSDSSIGAILRSIRDSLDTQGWAATGDNVTLAAGQFTKIKDTVARIVNDSNIALYSDLSAVACGGSGSQLDSIKVKDTSGTDVVVANTKVTVQLSGGNYTWLTTNGAGWAVFNLEPSTAYTLLGTTTGYVFPSRLDTTGSGANYKDSILGYDIAPTNSTPGSQQTTLYDWATIGVDTLKGATVTITLSGASDFYTSTDLVPAASWVVKASTTTGLWEKPIFGTDSLSCTGGGSAVYSVTIEHPILDQVGQVIRYDNLVIPANGATTRLRTVVAGQ